MEGATLLADGEGKLRSTVPQCPPDMDAESFKVFSNYVALPAREAFHIEYWALEDAKLRRQPAEKQLGRRVAVVFGGASGVGREVARLAAARGAHVIVADIDGAGAARVADELGAVITPESTISVAVRYAQPRIDSGCVERGGGGIRRR